MSNSIQFSAISGQQSAVSNQRSAISKTREHRGTPKQKHSFLQKNSHQQSAVSKEEVRYIYRILMETERWRSFHRPESRQRILSGFGDPSYSIRFFP